MEDNPRNGGSPPTAVFERHSIHLLKAGIREGIESLKDSAKRQYQKKASKYATPPHEVFFKAAPAEVPDWVAGFAALSDEVSFVSGKLATCYSGIIFLQAGSRLFALTFGYGRHALKGDAVEYDFGYEAVNRLVDEDCIDGVEFFSLENNSIRSSKQTALGAKIGRYGVNADNENIKALSGLSKDKRFGKRLSGSTPFNLNRPSDLLSLQTLCKELLGIYTNPRLRGAWRNRMALVREKHQLEALDEELLRVLNARELDQVSVGLPEGVMLSEHGLARLVTEDGVELDPLFDLGGYIQRIRKTSRLTKHLFRTIPIYERPFTGGAIIERGTFWECIEATITLTGASFYLSCGQWYKLDSDYLASLNNSLELVERFEMPPSFKGEVEGVYNERVAKKAGLYYLDKDLVRGPGFSSGLEFCDLLSSTGQLIHIKRGTRSSTMSHLLNQGYQSAYQSRMFPEFRKSCLDLLTKAGVPEKAQSFFKNDEFEVVFGIITDKVGSISTILPFMAKIALQQKVYELQKMRIKVRIALIPVIPKIIMRTGLNERRLNAPRTEI